GSVTGNDPGWDFRVERGYAHPSPWRFILCAAWPVSRRTRLCGTGDTKRRRRRGGGSSYRWGPECNGCAGYVARPAIDGAHGSRPLGWPGDRGDRQRRKDDDEGRHRALAVGG